MKNQAVAKEISEVVPGIFRVVLPLPIPDVASMNSYVITSGDRNLIIDPGMAHPVCCEIMERAIGELGLDLGRTDFFITHHHMDHFSLTAKLLSPTSNIYISKPESEFINRIALGEVEKELGIFLEALGFPEKNPTYLFSQFYGAEYRPKRPLPFKCISDGDILVRDRSKLACLVSPGHTIGHACLLESSRGLLISGDQITAGVQFLLDRANPLEDHFQSLARLKQMDVALALPGHGSPIRDHKKRIDLLMAHHQGRLEAAYAVLGDEGKDAYEVTVALDGLLADRNPLETMPFVLKFIHTRHSFAYLQHLTFQRRARKEQHHGRILFFR
jgi:glyoxylase-like metal-dependent hydrolase (beta-lactamase superfamily II)